MEILRRERFKKHAPGVNRTKDNLKENGGYRDDPAVDARRRAVEGRATHGRSSQKTVNGDKMTKVLPEYKDVLYGCFGYKQPVLPDKYTSNC